MNFNINAVSLLALCFVLSGCATNKVPQATGGSKADGIVELSFDYGGFEEPVVDWLQALKTAQEHCKAWGYADAKQFGGSISECQARNDYGCIHYFVTTKYQCID